MSAKTLDAIENGPAEIIGDDGQTYSVEIEIDGKPCLLRSRGVTGLPAEQTRHKIQIHDDIDFVELAAEDLGLH